MFVLWSFVEAVYAEAAWLQVNSCSDKRLLDVLWPCWKGLSAVSLGFLYIYYYIYTTDCAETGILGEGKENHSPKCYKITVQKGVVVDLTALSVLEKKQIQHKPQAHPNTPRKVVFNI